MAYARSSLAERHRLHAAAAQAYETHYADRLDEHAVILAHHYGHSLQPARMIAYALRAGDRAALLHANAEATTYYEEARAAAAALTSLAARRAEIDAVVKLAAVGASHRDVIERDSGNLERARVLAEQLADDSAWLRSSTGSGASSTFAGVLEQSLARARQIGATFALAWQRAFLAEAVLALGEPAAAALLCRETIRLAGEIGDRFPAACAHRTLAQASWRLDPFRLQQAVRALEPAVRILEEIGRDRN